MAIDAHGGIYDEGDRNLLGCCIAPAHHGIAARSGSETRSSTYDSGAQGNPIVKIAVQDRQTALKKSVEWIIYAFVDI
jgi:hypothetical protein